jgi:hypothetical protein
MDTNVVTSNNERYWHRKTIAAVVGRVGHAGNILSPGRNKVCSEMAPSSSPSGSAVLANLLQQTLIFDQYDRVAGTEIIFCSPKWIVFKKRKKKQRAKQRQAAVDTDKKVRNSQVGEFACRRRASHSVPSMRYYLRQRERLCFYGCCRSRNAGMGNHRCKSL